MTDSPFRERVAPAGGGVAGERMSLRDLLYMRANGGQAPPPLPAPASPEAGPANGCGNGPLRAIVEAPAAPRGNPQWARALYALGAILSVIAALAALAPRDQYTPVDPHSVPNVAGDSISGRTCPPGSWPQSATLINSAGPANIYQISCTPPPGASGGIVTEIAR